LGLRFLGETKINGHEVGESKPQAKTKDQKPKTNSLHRLPSKLF